MLVKVVIRDKVMVVVVIDNIMVVPMNRLLNLELGEVMVAVVIVPVMLSHRSRLMVDLWMVLHMRGRVVHCRLVSMVRVLVVDNMFVSDVVAMILVLVVRVVVNGVAMVELGVVVVVMFLVVLTVVNNVVVLGVLIMVGNVGDSRVVD